MGRTALLALRRKACWGIFRPKNPTASTGCEPANLGTKGQHATSRPPKPLHQTHYCEVNTISGTHKGRRQKSWEMLGGNSKTPRLALDSLLQGEHVEEMMDTFNCFLDLTYPLARPLSAVRICTSSGTVQRQMVQSAQCNTSHLRTVKRSPHAVHNRTLLYVAEHPI